MRAEPYWLSEHHFAKQTNPESPDFKQKTTEESLSIYGRHKPYRVRTELTRQGLQAQTKIEIEERPRVQKGKKIKKASKIHNYSKLGDATLVGLLKVCAKEKDLSKGSKIHADIRESGLLGKDVYVGAALVNMYAKCGALAKAQKAFEELPVRDVVSWSTLIAGYAQHGHANEALKCFAQMQDEGISPNAVTFNCILQACSSLGAVEKGKEIHSEIDRLGLLGNNVILGTALVDLYAKCGALTKAQEVFDKLSARNIVTWNVLIAGYAKHGHGDKALNLYEQMQYKGLTPDLITFTCILKACSGIGAVEKGTEIYVEVVRQGLLKESIMLGNAVVDMYAKCGALVKAQEVFDELPVRDVVAWSVLIAGYAQQGHGVEALNCFERMQDEGIFPNAVTYTCIVQACASIGAAEKGKELHAEVVRQGLLEKNIMLGTALVDMYAKCGMLAKAHEVFDELPNHDVVTWSALITGYAQNGHADEALNCFEQMRDKALSPDAVTFTCILKACGGLGTAEKGEEIHAEVIRQGLLENSVMIGTALVDMYAKCGALAKAQEVFIELQVRNVVSWNALIAGYAQHGLADEALNCFLRMQSEGMPPNSATFTVLLNACSHSGLLEEGETCFANMSTHFGINPTLEHHTCMVDLFSRSGHLDKAIRVIKMLSPSDCYYLWFALLGACKKWGNLKFGSLAFKHILQLDEKDAAAYVCMSNMFAASGMLDELNEVETMTLKTAACCQNMAHI